MASAEFAADTEGNGSLPGIHGTNYVYPDSNYVPDYTSPAYFASKGMNVFRLPFRWERLQRSLFGALDAAELQRLHTTVADLGQLGAQVILDVHNYARYGLVRTSSGAAAITGVDIAPSAFADLWSRIASEFRTDDHVIFGLMNEPHDMPTSAWLASANAAIAAIRNTGASQLILVAGNCWSGARGWTEPCGGSSNAETMIHVSDPGNNFAFEVHQYLNDNGSGASDTCVSATVGSERLAQFTPWARAHGVRAFLGEFAGGENSTCVAALDDMLDHVDANPDVYIGWTYWAGGPWWGSARSLEPAGGQDKPTMAPLLMHLGTSTAQWQLTASASPTQLPAGQTTQITASVRNAGAALTGFIQVMRRGGGLPDLVLRNCSGPIAGSGGLTTCNVAWTPNQPGAFTISAGVFDSAFNFIPGAWADGLASIAVASTDPAQYSFETSAQGWTTTGAPVPSVAQTTARAFAGSGSLGMAVNAAASGQALAQSTLQPLPGPGADVAFHVYVPTTAGLVSLQPFVQEGAPGWRWTGTWVAGSSLALGWNTFHVNVPTDAAALSRFGIEVTTDGSGASEQLFVDSIGW
ncbi:MAG: glycoside hydrolase family 5 protein [bacterium]